MEWFTNTGPLKIKNGNTGPLKDLLDTSSASVVLPVFGRYILKYLNNTLIGMTADNA
jgi:hypothetical protein